MAVTEQIAQRVASLAQGVLAKTCPLCECEQAKPSWFGSIFYHEREFSYLECLSCHSLYCDPMPDDETLAQMYGPNYLVTVSASGAEEPQEASTVVEWLKRSLGTTFVDYGCGAGTLLKEALKLNWQAIGVEYDEQVAQRTQQRTGARVVSESAVFGAQPVADVLNLSDVIEHLTQASRQMPEILRLLKPGGMLLAQGPLEANFNLFALGLRLARWLHRGQRTEGTPYHVLFATAQGQRQFFRRLGLEEVEYTVREVAWPAPERLSLAVVRQPRQLALFLLRRLSQAVSALNPGRFGNRYFYAGRLHG
jgi:SAM-dependent methyltransferase